MARPPKIEPPDHHHVNAAIGWIGLGNYAEAEADLARVAERWRNHPEVLGLRFSIEGQRENWQRCYDLAQTMTELDAADSQGWINLSIAAYKLGRTQEAWDILAPKALEFPDQWLVVYNLACYAAQLGMLDEGKRLLEKAMRLGSKEQVERLLASDPDLAPLRHLFSR